MQRKGVLVKTERNSKCNRQWTQRNWAMWAVTAEDLGHGQ